MGAFNAGRRQTMSNWLHNLPLIWMAIVVFSATYLFAILVQTVIGMLATGEHSTARVRPAGAVGDDEQQREEHEVHDDRGSAVGDERQRDPGERDHARDPSDDHEHLQREDRAKPDRSATDD